MTKTSQVRGDGMIAISEASGGRRGEATWLRRYDPGAFPRFAVTVDLAVLTIRSGLLCALLVERGEHPYRGWWALPGGHVQHGSESVEEAAVRELGEETGIQVSAAGLHLEQLRTYADPRRDPRIAVGLHVASVAYVALTADLPEPEGGSDAVRARWWPVNDLDLVAQRERWFARKPFDGAAVPLAFDHAVILDDAVQRATAKLEYTTLAATFMSEPFTLAELRRVYEAVWGAAPDLANFRRKVLSVPDFLIPVDGIRRASSEAGRPPAFYRRGGAYDMNPPMMRPNRRADA
jgi:8-oxo-dGTP diphosphatase